MKLFSCAAAVATGLVLAGAAMADSHATMDHGAMGHGAAAPMTMTAPQGASAATQGYVAAMNTMSMAMTGAFTGDADVDFIRGMIPHHQSAVDSARVVLEHGNDPEVRAFAQQVIAAQEQEIAWMTQWLADRGM